MAVTNYQNDQNYDYDNGTTVVRNGQPIYDWMPEWGAATGKGPIAGGDPGSASPAVSKPAGGYNYEALRDNWSGGNADQLSQYLSSHPEWSQGVTQTGKNRDQLQLPGGAGTIDAIIGAAGGGTGRGWTPTGGAAQNPTYAAQPQQAPIGAAPAVSTVPGPNQNTGINGSGGVPGATSPTAGSNVDPMVKEALQRLLARGEAPVGDMQGDPRAQAYAAARQQGAQRERAQLAERAAFTGVNSGGQGSGSFDTGLAGIQQNAGNDIAGQQAGLVGEEMQARRQDTLNALNLANSVGARDQSTALAQQLAKMDDDLKRFGYAQQESQFTRGQSQQDRQFNADLGYRNNALSSSNANFNANLNQNQSQWNDTYGLNREALLAQLNAAAYNGGQ